VLSIKAGTLELGRKQALCTIMPTIFQTSLVYFQNCREIYSTKDLKGLGLRG
jgi:hypothetical protein